MIRRDNIAARAELGRELIASGIEEHDLELLPDPGVISQVPDPLDLQDRYPDGLAPNPEDPDPQWVLSDPLPQADVLVITWTIAEQRALADVLTPGFSRARWTRYNRRFEEHYRPLIRRGAPASNALRLGSWLRTNIGQKSVICYKSELHLNQDGIRDYQGSGQTTLPVKDMFHQLIEEVNPQVVLTVGTSGGVYLDHDLGDTAVTRGAKFRCSSEFEDAPFNHRTHPNLDPYRSEWDVPTAYFEKAEELMGLFAHNLEEPPFLPPTKRHSPEDEDAPFPNVSVPQYTPDIKLDGRDMPEFHPILTTDFFEFGTHNNNLEDEGCAVEMGDAVLGLVASELQNPPDWLVLRNLSDPQINGDLARDLQVNWAVYYYEEYGYWTSVMSALATWAVIAGLP